MPKYVRRECQDLTDGSRLTLVQINDDDGIRYIVQILTDSLIEEPEILYSGDSAEDAYFVFLESQIFDQCDMLKD